jgi:NAD(P)-dependent dehydrogenase (short-subunit alcohol dehydrogenase family)
MTQPSGEFRPLQGRVALVTGAHKRLGRAVALGLARSGARVAVHHRHDPELAAQVVAEITANGGEAAAFSADLVDPAQVAALVAAVGARFRRLDVLVACAAGYEPTPVDRVSAADIDRVLALNARAPVDLVLRCRPLLAASGDGRAIVFGDLAGVTPFAGYLAHSMAKAALHAGVRALASELAPDIAVNAVLPGTVLTPEDLSPDAWRQLQARVPMGGMALEDPQAPVDAIVDAVRYLATCGRFVTGTLLPVDGGRTARW